jgi:methionyl-tRNA formyltransferase
MKSAFKTASPQNFPINDVASYNVLYITECSPWGQMGYEKVASAFRSVRPIFWSPGMPKPDLSDWEGDLIISFKSDLILSREILSRAKKEALNFHPSPPKYRGLGGYWWALHNGDDVFGVTCHHMNERIDHGDIIATDSFSILPGETVESLKHRAAIHSLALLDNMLDDILNEKSLAPCGVVWEPHLYTSKELALAQSTSAAKDSLSNSPPFIKSPDARRALEALESIIKEHLSLHL